MEIYQLYKLSICNQTTLSTTKKWSSVFYSTARTDGVSERYIIDQSNRDWYTVVGGRDVLSCSGWVTIIFKKRRAVSRSVVIVKRKLVRTEQALGGGGGEEKEWTHRRL